MEDQPLDLTIKKRKPGILSSTLLPFEIVNVKDTTSLDQNVAPDSRSTNGSVRYGNISHNFSKMRNLQNLREERQPFLNFNSQIINRPWRTNYFQQAPAIKPRVFFPQQSSSCNTYSIQIDGRNGDDEGIPKCRTWIPPTSVASDKLNVVSNIRQKNPVPVRECEPVIVGETKVHNRIVGRSFTIVVPSSQPFSSILCDSSRGDRIDKQHAPDKQNTDENNNFLSRHAGGNQEPAYSSYLAGPYVSCDKEAEQKSPESYISSFRNSQTSRYPATDVGQGHALLNTRGTISHSTNKAQINRSNFEGAKPQMEKSDHVALNHSCSKTLRSTSCTCIGNTDHNNNVKGHCTSKFDEDISTSNTMGRAVYSLGGKESNPPRDSDIVPEDKFKPQGSASSVKNTLDSDPQNLRLRQMNSSGRRSQELFPVASVSSPHSFKMCTPRHCEKSSSVAVYKPKFYIMNKFKPTCPMESYSMSETSTLGHKFPPMRSDKFPPVRSDKFPPMRSDKFQPMRRDKFQPVRSDEFPPMRNDRCEFKDEMMDSGNDTDSDDTWNYSEDWERQYVNKSLGENKTTSTTSCQTEEANVENGPVQRDICKLEQQNTLYHGHVQVPHSDFNLNDADSTYVHKIKRVSAASYENSVKSREHNLGTGRNNSSENEDLGVTSPVDLHQCETFYWCHSCEKMLRCDEKEANKHNGKHNSPDDINLSQYFLQVYGPVTRHWKGFNRQDRCVYLCGLCDTAMLYTRGFRQHILTHGRGHKCARCSKFMPSRKKLVEHKRYECGKRGHSCPICERRFSSLQRLRVHIRVHTRTSRSSGFGCTYCGKRLSSRSSLTTHIRLHTGNNPYKCSLCSNSYPQNVQLKLHMKSHRKKGDVL